MSAGATERRPKSDKSCDGCSRQKKCQDRECRCKSTYENGPKRERHRYSATAILVHEPTARRRSAAWHEICEAGRRDCQTEHAPKGDLRPTRVKQPALNHGVTDERKDLGSDGGCEPGKPGDAQMVEGCLEILSNVISEERKRPDDQDGENQLQ